MAIEIVDFPMKNGDFPWQNVSSPEGKLWKITIFNGKIHYKWQFSIAFCRFTRGYRMANGIAVASPVASQRPQSIHPGVEVRLLPRCEAPRETPWNLATERGSRKADPSQ